MIHRTTTGKSIDLNIYSYSSCLCIFLFISLYAIIFPTEFNEATQMETGKFALLYGVIFLNENAHYDE